MRRASLSVVSSAKSQQQILVCGACHHNDIHEAAFTGDLRTLRKMIESNNDNLNMKNALDQTPLHKAAMNGWTESAAYLIECGAQVNAADVAGCTPLHFAAANGYVEIARLLVEKGQTHMNKPTAKGHTARYLAKSNGQIQMIAFFNEIENRLDKTSVLTQGKQ